MSCPRGTGRRLSTQSEFFDEGGKNKIRMIFGEKTQVTLRAHAEPPAEELAAPYCYHGLQRIVARTLGVGGRV